MSDIAPAGSALVERPRPSARARSLHRRDEAAVARLLSQDPVQNVYLRSELRSGLAPGEWLGVDHDGELRSVVAGGALLVPWIDGRGDAELLGAALVANNVRMLVGPRESVLALHHALGRRAREIRAPQLLMSVDTRALRRVSTGPMRLATAADLDDLVRAAASMHREEMGVDPLLVDAAGWRARMRQLIDRGWSWVWRERGRIVFKAELSAWTPEAVQVQGVYTTPDARRRGIATRGLGTMCDALLASSALCTLYVNHYNAVALKLYDRLGFQTVSSFATVIY